MGVDIADEDFILHIVSNLPEEYDILVEMLEDELDTLNIEHLCDKLSAKYEKIKKRKNPTRRKKNKTEKGGEETALIASNEVICVGDRLATDNTTVGVVLGVVVGFLFIQ